MKFERTTRFDNDFRSLLPEHRRQFLDLIPEFNAACEPYAADPVGHVWPKRQRVSRMRSAKGIHEMTWSFNAPDGRATFECVAASDGMRVRWRRIGSHQIYRQP